MDGIMSQPRVIIDNRIVEYCRARNDVVFFPLLTLGNKIADDRLIAT
jgi:hypothetical protein